jgi:hypothetical protein
MFAANPNETGSGREKPVAKTALCAQNTAGNAVIRRTFHSFGT